MGESTHSPRMVRFGVYEVDLRAGELRKSGVKIKLQEQPFQILALLLGRPGEVVTREEIQKKLWPADTFVDFEHSLNAAVKRLREALGDSADNPRFVETLPRRGYRFIYPVEGRPSTALGIKGRAGLDGRRIGRRAWLAALGLLALAAVVIGLNVAGLRERLLGEAGRGQITSIAVLPLENMMGDAEQDYFVAGMHEALITELSKIGALTVISRTSAMRYRNTDKSVPEIARELGVDAVVEGSVLRVENTVRITAQLIEAATDRNLWADNFDRELRDILALHSDVARAIAREIKITLTPQEQVQLGRAQPVDPEAYQLYLKGNFQLTRLSQTGFRKAVEHYQQAIEKVPAYAPAYAGLSVAYLGLGSWHTSVPATAELSLKAKSAAQKALELDEKLAEAHIALGRIKQLHEWDWQGAEGAFRRGIELNPNATFPRILYANYLTALGRFEESIVIGKRTLEIDPLSPAAYNEYGWALEYAGRDEEALEQYRKGLELDPDFAQSHGVLASFYLRKGLVEKAIIHTEKEENSLGETRPPPPLGLVGNVYARAGRRVDALRILNELKRRAKSEHVPAMALAHIYLGLGEYEVALELLERAYEERFIGLVWLKVGRRYDPLRSDPRFQALLRRMNFPED